MIDDAHTAAAATDVDPRAPGITPEAVREAIAWMESLPSMDTDLNEHEQTFIQAARAWLALQEAEPTEEMVEAAAAVIHLEIGSHRQYAEKLTRAALTAALGARGAAALEAAERDNAWLRANLELARESASNTCAALEALTATRDDLVRSGLPEQYAPIVMRTVREAIVEARDAALEEAARECDAQMVMSDRPRTPRDAAIAIRVLKSTGA